MINIKNLYKYYNKIEALKGVNLNVNKGEIFGLIGPDGAGKTTLMRIITTLLEFDSGEVKVCGIDPVKEFKELRTKLGYMPGRFSLYQDLSVEENLKFFASIFDVSIKDNYHLIEDIYKQLEPFKNRRAGKLSGGMKQKLALSCSLIHKPELLILDEPTTGVDAVSRAEFWDILKKLKKMGITIFVSTPYMDEANLCDRIALIQNGYILEIDEPKNITKKHNFNLYSLKTNNNYYTLKLFRNYKHMKIVYPFGETIHYIDKRSNQVLDELRNDFKEIQIDITEKTIEDVFIYLMSQKNND